MRRFSVRPTFTVRGRTFKGLRVWRAGVSVLTAVTGWDAWKSSRPGTQPRRRTINSHGTIMITVTLLALAYIGWRLNHHNSRT